jgi:hypothetical protein
LRPLDLFDAVNARPFARDGVPPAFFRPFRLFRRLYQPAKVFAPCCVFWRYAVFPVAAFAFRSVSAARSRLLRRAVDRGGGRTARDPGSGPQCNAR